jgi:hypothetical protein
VDFQFSWLLDFLAVCAAGLDHAARLLVFPEANLLPLVLVSVKFSV